MQLGTPRVEVRPLDAPPRPQVLELSAPKVADSLAVDHLGEEIYGEKISIDGVKPCTMTCLALETLPLPAYDLMNT